LTIKYSSENGRIMSQKTSTIYYLLAEECKNNARLERNSYADEIEKVVAV